MWSPCGALHGAQLPVNQPSSLTSEPGSGVATPAFAGGPANESTSLVLEAGCRLHNPVFTGDPPNESSSRTLGSDCEIGTPISAGGPADVQSSRTLETDCELGTPTSSGGPAEDSSSRTLAADCELGTSIVPQGLWQGGADIRCEGKAELNRTVRLQAGEEGAGRPLLESSIGGAPEVEEKKVQEAWPRLGHVGPRLCSEEDHQGGRYRVVLEGVQVGYDVVEDGHVIVRSAGAVSRESVG
jgi:hypothetical protein